MRLYSIHYCMNSKPESYCHHSYLFIFFVYYYLKTVQFKLRPQNQVAFRLIWVNSIGNKISLIDLNLR